MAAKKKTSYVDENPFETAATAVEGEAVTTTIEDVDASLYGRPDMSGVGRQVAKPIALDEIIPDLAQPRQAIPLSIRNAARSSNEPEWTVWHRVAEQLNGKPIDLSSLLRGEGEGALNDPLGIPMVDSFMDLVSLAASIYRDGLANAITVQARGERYEIETGERRYQAYKMLFGALGDAKFNKINARVVPKADVWRQAAENGARRPLNAIGMARQLALLIMDLWRGRDGASFVPYGQMVQDGDVDRKFYAQVADGNIWRIPKGASERILQVTGLKSKGQLHQYRLLLNVPDDIWAKADEENWAEFKIREHMASLRPPQDRSTAVDLSSQNGAQYNPYPMPAAPAAPLKRMRFGSEIVGYIQMNEDGKRVRIQHYDANGAPSYQSSVPKDSLRELNTPAAAAPSPFSRELPPTISTEIKQRAGLIGDLPPTRTPKIVPGQIYKHRFGSRLYEVVGIAGESVSCYEVNPGGKRLTRAPFPMKIENLAEIDPPVTVPETASPTIWRHIESEKLYRVVETLPGDWVRAVAVDETGAELSGQIHAESMKKLVPYAGEPEDEAFEAAIETSAEDTPPAETPLSDETSDADESVLPDWCVPGAAARHRDSGKICDVVGTAWDEEHQIWLLIVDIRDGGGRTDAPRREFDHYIEEAAPRERHPALHPHNMSGVIVQEQHDMGSLINMSDTLKMKQLTSLIIALQVLTAHGLRTRLRQSSREQVQAWLDTLYRACMDVLQQMVQRIDVVYTNAVQVLDDLDAEQRGGS